MINPDKTMESPQETAQPDVRQLDDLTTPLTKLEWAELDQLMLREVDSPQCMTLDMLDGFLHGLVIGPEPFTPRQWLPKVWGAGGRVMPPMRSNEYVERLLSLVFRHESTITERFQRKPATIYPCWRIRRWQEQDFDDAEMWSSGFCEAVKFGGVAWRPWLKTPEGSQCYAPIGLLGEDNFSADQDTLTSTLPQRHALAQNIPESLRTIHAHWLPFREANYQRYAVRRSNPGLGRNEPCPCGSGKKFKKCCGSPTPL